MENPTGVESGPPEALSQKRSSYERLGEPPNKSRRITCDICRERKVRCDRGQPSCGRCKRLRQECVYTPSSKKTWHFPEAVLLNLHTRLAQAEALLGATPEKRRSRSTSVSAIGELQQPQFLPENNDGKTELEFENSQMDGVLGWGDFEQWPEMSQNGRDTMMAGSMQTPTPLLTSFECPALWPGVINHQEVSSEILSNLHQQYFEKFHKFLPMIEQERFLFNESQSDKNHHQTSLSYAVAMIGATISDEFAYLKPFCYSRARDYLEKAERNEDGAKFLGVEALQSLLLIVWYEFSEVDSPRAWMTLGRAARLIRLMGFEKIDATDKRTHPSGFRATLPIHDSPTEAEIEERRRTFWAMFILDCYAEMKTSCSLIFKQTEILTQLPKWEILVDDQPVERQDFLEGFMSSVEAPQKVSYTHLIAAFSIFSCCLEHLRKSLDLNDGRYDFWSSHHRLEKKIVKLSSAPWASSTQVIPAVDDHLFILARLTMHGVVILLHKTLIEQGKKTKSPESSMSRSRARCAAAATEISNLLVGVDLFQQENAEIYTRICIFVSWPLFLAARVQMQMLNDPGLKKDKKEEKIKSLEIICTTMKSLKDYTGYCGQVTHDVGEFLKKFEQA